MGFDEDRFVGTIGADRKCALCRGVLDNPLIAPCGRRFCSACVLPPVVQTGRCPVNDCTGCNQLTPGDLHNMLGLRAAILNMRVKCDYASRGCSAVVVLADLSSHVADCEYRPVQCRNRGCTEVHDRRDLAQHEADTCHYRPVGLCQQGCGLMLVYKDVAPSPPHPTTIAESNPNTTGTQTTDGPSTRKAPTGGHNCLEALKCQLVAQEAGVAGLQAEVQRLVARFGKRERSLLSQVASLHSEIQVQALRFQKKLNDYRFKIAYVSKKAALTQAEEVHVTVVLDRGKGSLGFNIMGGYTPDSLLTDGIVVSRVAEGGVADQAGLRLDDQILKVNGQDLSQSSHEEAVEAFRTAKEPIVVEVLRRVTKSSSTNGTTSGGTKMKQQPAAPPVPMVSTATQTDDYLDDMPYYGFFGDEDEDAEAEIYAFNGNGSLMNPTSRQAVAFSPSVDLGLTDIEMANGLDYDDQYIDEMEYEEVTLTRKCPSDKIGLTLCYGSAVADITDVFVSEIEPNGVAGRSGRIHEGDQILQINGVDVHSREQAIRLFAENRTDLTLLLSRPQLVQMDDGFMDEHNILDELPMEMLEQHACTSTFSQNLLTQGNDEEGGTTDTATTENSSNKQEKDSGVGRTDESTRNDESSEQEIMENECTSPSSSSKFPGACKLGGGGDELHYSNDSFTSTEAHDHELIGANEISAEECKKFREVLETRCSSVENSPRRAAAAGGPAAAALNGGGAAAASLGVNGATQSVNGGGGGSDNSKDGGDLTRKDSQGSIEREIAMLNKEMEMIQIECQEIVEAHARERQRIHPDSGGGGSGSGGGSGTSGGGGGSGTGIAAGMRPEPYRSPRMVPRMGTKLDYTKQALAAQDGNEPIWVRHDHMSPLAKEALRLKSKRLPTEELKDKDTSTTSAYNTGDSCRSTPLTLELNAGGDASKNSLLSLAHPKPSHSDSEKMTQTQSQTLTKKEWNSDGDAKKRLGKSTSNTSMTEKMSQTQLAMSEEKLESLQDLYAQYADVMYTNRANLEHTIMVQQKLFQQQLMQRTHVGGAVAEKERAIGGGGDAAAATTTTATTTATAAANSAAAAAAAAAVVAGASSSGQMEWVVKRRADGSRYITRRPVRNKILKERSRKIAEERCGLTTDDDAQSEMKIGRYWTREDRKRHLEKARDHKRRKEQMIKQRMETLKENDGEGKKEPNIVDLSHRKMMRHKGKKVFDDFTTVQEMLAHGSREHQGKTYNPLLSVTTV